MQLQRRVAARIEQLSTAPHGAGTKQLAGIDSSFRARVGGYRILYEVEPGMLFIASIRLHYPTTPALLRQPVLDVDSIEWRNVEYRFQPPLRVKRSRKYGHVVLENSDLSLYAYGESDEDAMKALAREFAAVWNVIAEQDNAKLETMARGLKRQLRKAVSSIWRKV